MRPRGMVLSAVLLAALAGCARSSADVAAGGDTAPQDPAERRSLRTEPVARSELPAQRAASPGVYGPPGAARSAEVRSAEVRAADMRAAAIATVPPRGSRRPFVEARELIGLERGEIAARLGPPTVTRTDAPAEIWQYRTPVCVLDLVLYAEGTTLRVAHADMRPRDGRAVAAASCLASF